MNVADMIPASEQAAELMRSLSHPQRLLVLCALVDGEKSVAQLRDELAIEQVPMSQQLMRLRSDGLVEARREGTSVFYRIAREEVLAVIAALHKAFWPGRGEGCGAPAPGSALRLGRGLSRTGAFGPPKHRRRGPGGNGSTVVAHGCRPSVLLHALEGKSRGWPLSEAAARADGTVKQNARGATATPGEAPGGGKSGAFSSEGETGSREENASQQKPDQKKPSFLGE